MAERWAERSIADLVLRAWCPFLVNRGPVSQLGYNTNQEDIAAQLQRQKSRTSESRRSGIESIPNPKGCHLLGNASHTTMRCLKGAARFAFETARRGGLHRLVSRREARGGHSWRNGHPFFSNEPLRCVCRDRCDETPDSAARESSGDPVWSGVHYPAHACRALRG